MFVTFCVLSGIFDNNKYQKYALINYGVLKKIGKVIKIKPIIISQEECLYRICKHIDNFSYLSISVTDDNKNIIATYTEPQFLKLLEKFNATTPFKYVIKLKKYN